MFDKLLTVEIYCIQSLFIINNQVAEVKIYLVSTGQEKNKAAGWYAQTKASIDTIASFIKSITYHKQMASILCSYVKKLDKSRHNILQCE